MNSESKPNITSEVATYLNEIAERLWSGHASVMVGAGFSKNARPATTTRSSFPTWNELGDCLHEKLHGHTPDHQTPHYLNPLKLADEVQAAFGRPALDQLLRTRIPDKEFEPSDQHVSLLELPWVDVFTVNYDTLLERASAKVTSRRFDVVVNREDLVYSTRPRIVKLHGSFPSTRPLVVSEEDYRQYPTQFASFVNTVQQSLLENTLCLIGFSADDPNFLHWIGWVRDNLGANNSPRMYLVGLPSLTLAQKRLLEQRNIVVIDLAQCPDGGGEHAKAFSIFFDYLHNRRPGTLLDWPRNAVALSSSTPHPIEDITQSWSEERESYPNWVVAPESSREALWRSLRKENLGLRFLDSAGPIAPPLDISFLYELNWRIEHTLYPIPNALSPHFERILSRYNPYPESLPPVGAEVTPEIEEYAHIDWTLLAAQWLELNLSLLRFFREEGLPEKWTGISDRLEMVKARLSPSQSARLSYERCMNALFSLDLAETRKEIGAWPANPTLPFWEVKRAGLLAELGDIPEAAEILEEALAAIRSNQQLAPVIKDYTWVSQESLAMLLLYSVKQAICISASYGKIDGNLRQQYENRWNELKQYKCDPWNDLKLFDVRLRVPPVAQEVITRKKEFDIGMETITQHMGGEDGPLLGYTFLRYCEDVGLPFTLPLVNIASSPAQHAAERISSFSPAWAVVTMLRLGDAKLADSFFGRGDLAAMNVARVDESIDRFVAVLRAAQPVITQGDRFKGKNLGVRIAHVIPEILSRLCTKCSPSRIGEMLKLLRQLYESPTRFKYGGVDHLTQRLLGSMSGAQQYAKLPELLEFPILRQGHHFENRGYPEPFAFISATRTDASGSDIPADRMLVDKLLVFVASQDDEERSRACFRLRKLYDLGLLDEEQSVALGRHLWSQVGADGFPIRTPFHNWAFLNLPVPDGIDAVALFKAYFLNFSFESIDDVSGGMRVGLVGQPSINVTHGNIPYCGDLLGSTKRADGTGIIDWSTTEAIVLFDKLIGWWNAGKSRLRGAETPSAFPDISDEFRARYGNLVELLVVVVAPRLAAEVDSSVRNRLKGLLEELDAYGQRALRVHAACIAIFPADRGCVLRRIDTGIASSDPGDSLDAFEAAHVLLSTDHLITEIEAIHLLTDVGQQIKWRRGVSLVHAMGIMSYVVKKIPQLFSEELEEVVLPGMQCLVKETDAKTESQVADIGDRLIYRRSAAALAFVLYKHYMKAEVAPPSVILDWQRICADPEEFAEIRNQWEA